MVEVFNTSVLVLFLIQVDSVMNVLFYVFSSKLHQDNKKAGYISIAACLFSLTFYILWFYTSIKLVDDFTKIKSIVFIIADLIMLYRLANKFKIL